MTEETKKRVEELLKDPMGLPKLAECFKHPFNSKPDTALADLKEVRNLCSGEQYRMLLELVILDRRRQWPTWLGWLFDIGRALGFIRP